MDYTGECFCGAVAYRVAGEIFGARSCHCSRCRKAFSAQASAYAIVAPETFTWTRGEELLTSYIGKHGGGMRFCSVCGSTLCGVVDGRVHGITLGCLNEAPAGLALDTHIYVGSKAPWERMPDGVTCYDDAPPPGVLDVMPARGHRS
jgi:hypothetical protein